jgi:hypothetical protein
MERTWQLNLPAEIALPETKLAVLCGGTILLSSQAERSHFIIQRDCFESEITYLLCAVYEYMWGRIT